MRNKTKSLTTVAIFTAIIFLLGMTPLGLIPLGFINLTIVHIPVIVGAMCLKRKQSLVLGMAFGMASTLAAFGMSFAAQSGLAVTLMTYSPIAVIAVCMIPRIAIPITTKTTYDIMRKIFKLGKKANRRAVSLAAIIGSFTNTVLYLGLMGMFFAMYGIWEDFAVILSVVLLVGAVAEAIAAALIAGAVVPAVQDAREDKYDLQVADKGDDEDSKITDSFDSSVDEFNVAVIPSSESLLPNLTDADRMRIERCRKYIADNNMLMANSAFDAYIRAFHSDEEKWNLNIYAIMCFIEMSKYKSASDRLIELCKTDIAANVLDSDKKQVLLGIMNIIHTSVAGDAQNPIESALADKIFTEASDCIRAEKTQDAAINFEEYIKRINARDRDIKSFDDGKNPYSFAAEQKDASADRTFCLRDISAGEESTEEGISIGNVAVVPTAASVKLPESADTADALRILEMDLDATEAFEKLIENAEPEDRINIDRFIMLTYFERGDYIQALHSLIKCMKRDYQKEIFESKDIKATVMGILTIIHTSMRAVNPENTQNADKLMQKAIDFYERGAMLLSAQILEKYFISTGLAK